MKIKIFDSCFLKEKKTSITRFFHKNLRETFNDPRNLLNFSWKAKRRKKFFDSVGEVIVRKVERRDEMGANLKEKKNDVRKRKRVEF